MGVKAANVGRINTIPFAEQGVSDEEELKVKKYLRGEAADLGVLQDKKLKGQLAVREALYGKSAQAAAKAEKWLMPSEGGYLEAEGIEKTWRIKQEAIAGEVDILSTRKQFDIVLPGSDLISYVDMSQMCMCIGSASLISLSGARSIHSGFYFEWSIYGSSWEKRSFGTCGHENMDLVKEFQVRETVRDVVFLHDQKLLAAAQKKYVYMYNENGTEMHCLKEHGAATKLQFLHKHFLLTSINKLGQLHFQDITTGQMIGNFERFRRSDVMQVNPFNNVVTVGHSGGTVSMWKPTSAAPLVKMLCHKGPVIALAFHSNGHLMATAGMERKIKLWDLRKFEVLQTLPGHATTMDFSQKGLLATATGSFVQILGDLSGSHEYSRYMGHSMAKGYQIRNMSFRPYEDVLAIGHSMGWSSILIPGSGEPNFDTWVANPFETRKQRNEKEPTRRKEKLSKQEREAEQEAAVEGAKNIPLKKKTKGRSKPSKVAKKKQEAVAKAKKPFLEQQTEDKEMSKKKRKRIGEENQLPKSLQRFARKVPTT
ncbi:hypothetical protein DH2020_028281 [Rehmannia glutinosa]|uniref:BING4 C-terminal domain-containing protein n=1 Tax=Rehmannia glutinosa TaxID=99300 RepID=A0ABR0VSR2_REHGL